MTESERDLERLRAAFTHDASVGGELDDCPAMELIWEGVCGRLPSDERDALIDHMAACAACSESWRVAMESARAGGWVPRVTGELVARPTSRGWWIGGSLIAAAAMTLALLVPWQGSAPAPAVYRDDSQQRLTNLDPDARRVARADVLLRWSPIADGTLYQVEIATEQLDAVYSARGLSVSELRVPAAALNDLPRESKLYWRVEAVDRAGHRIASATYSIVLE